MEKEGATEDNNSRSKRRRLSFSGQPGTERIEDNEVMTDIIDQNSEIYKKLRDCYNQRTLDTMKAARVLHSPFKSCQIFDFVNNEKLISALEQELLDDNLLQMEIKSNDLYCFKQSLDLNGLSCDKFPALCFFIELLISKVRPLLEDLTGIQLKSEIAVTSSIYKYGDFLLCHDDKLEGRRIAFIYYLTPEDWDSARDGGALELYDVDPKSKMPLSVVDHLNPSRNSFSFFEVSPVSFHRVTEVTRTVGSRLSINGWFMGPKSEESCLETLQQGAFNSVPWNPCDIEETEFLQWLSPSYLSSVTLSQILRHFTRSFKKKHYSDLILSDIFEATAIRSLVEQLNDIADGEKSCTFIHRGPPNRRSYSVLDISPEVLKCPSTQLDKFVFLLLSDAFMVLLSQMTGLSFLDVSNATNRARCIFFEVRMWSPGDYSLLRDTDESLKPGDVALHYFVMSDINSTSLEQSCETYVLSIDANPGSIVYAEKGRKEPIVTIDPKHNALAVVVSSPHQKHADKHGLVHFNRYMNSVVFGKQRYFEFYLVFGNDSSDNS